MFKKESRMKFKNGQLVTKRLDKYIKAHWRKQSLNPMFFILFYIQNLLHTLKFVAGASFLALVLFNQNNEIYKFIIALIFVSALVPIFIYLNHRQSFDQTGEE
jgi:hypothetical protein